MTRGALLLRPLLTVAVLPAGTRRALFVRLQGIGTTVRLWGEFQLRLVDIWGNNPLTGI